MNWIELNKTEGLLTMVILVNNESILENVKRKANQIIRETPGLNVCIEGIWNDDIDTYSKAKNEALNMVPSEYVIFVKDDEFINDYYETGWVKSMALCRKVEDFSNLYVDNYSFERIIMLNSSRLAGLVVNVEAVKKVGGFNEALSSADDYEILLRLDEYKEFLNEYDYMVKFANFEIKPVYAEDFVTYALVLFRYSKKLKEINLFNEAFLRKANWAVNFNQNVEFENCYAAFIRNDSNIQKEMKYLDPIIIAVDNDRLCYDVIDGFSKDFYEACLRNKRGCFMVDNTNDKWIPKAKKMHISAIIGFQSAAFAAKEKEQAINDIKCPKIMNIFDHPLYIIYFLMFPIDDFYCVSCDGNYSEFARNNFEAIRKGYRWFPAGRSSKNLNKEKIYDVIFLGTYTDYRSFVKKLYDMPRMERIIANKMLHVLKNHTDTTFEGAYKWAIDSLFKDDENMHDYYKNRKQMLVTLHHMWPVARLITSLYREKVIKAILDSNIELHVFGDSWKCKEFSDYKNLIIHEEVGYEESFDVYAKSKISLNVFSWHKDCVSERIINSMMNKSLCISDGSKALNECFKNKEQIAIYSLDKIDELPDMIRYYLTNEDERLRIVDNAYKEAKNNHTWDKRVDEFNEILKDIYKL